MADLANQVERSLKTLSLMMACFLKFAEKPGPTTKMRVLIKAEKFQNMRDLFKRTVWDHAEWEGAHELSDEKVLESHPTLVDDSINTFLDYMDDAINICLGKFIAFAEANPDLEMNIPEVQAKKSRWKSQRNFVEIWKQHLEKISKNTEPDKTKCKVTTAYPVVGGLSKKRVHQPQEIAAEVGKEIDEEASKKILEVDDVRKRAEDQISYNCKKHERDLPASVLPELVKEVAA